MVIQVLAQGLSLGAILLLGALGLTIIYGVMGVVNLAHGEFVMLGAYVMAITSVSLGPWLAIACAPIIVGLIGLVCDRTVVRHVYGDPITSMLATFGLALVLRQLVVLIEGPELRYVGLPLDGAIAIGFGETFALWRLVLVVLAIAAAVGTALWITRTATGLGVRMTTADRDVAESLGINVSRVNALTFAVGAGLAGLAGALLAPLNSVFPDMGTTYLVGAFLVVVLAGLGRVGAAAGWAMAVGLLTASIAVPVDDVIAQVVVWSAALMIIAVRREALVPARV